MTAAAQKYFQLYYRLERMVDEEREHSIEADDLRKELDDAFAAMTERERELLDIVDKNRYK